MWYWNLNEASSNAWTNIGARLLNLGLGVFECFCCRDDTRVGGAYWDNTNAGLWNWNVDNASSKANANIGARLIILVFDVYLGYMMKYLSAVILRRLWALLLVVLCRGV